MATIEHDQWGRVEGVYWERTNSRGEPLEWAKEENDRKTVFKRLNGWRAVREEKWVNVTDEYEVTAHFNITLKHGPGLDLKDGDRFAVVPRHHLPEDVKDHWLAFKRAHQGFADHHIDCMIEAFLKPFLENVIIVERREGEHGY